MPIKSILFLDLDGTIRHPPSDGQRYIRGPEDVVIYPEVPQLLARYRAAGWILATVTNQSAIRLGRVPLHRVMSAIGRTEALCDLKFDYVRFCPHHPDVGSPCWCRKPRPGMIFQTVEDLRTREPHPDHIPTPEDCLMVGDQDIDQACAQAAGVPFMWAADWRQERGP